MLRGQLTGKWPDGLASPNSMSATPLPPWLPGYQASRMAGTCSAAQEISSGRPFTSTRTTGLPVAETASSSSSCPFESLREDREAYSPLIRSISPRTRTATSLCASQGYGIGDGLLRFLSGRRRLFLHHCGQSNASKGEGISRRMVRAVRVTLRGLQSRLFPGCPARRYVGSGLLSAPRHREQVGLGVAKRADDRDGVDGLAALISRQQRPRCAATPSNVARRLRASS